MMIALITDSAIKPVRLAKILVQFNYVVFMHFAMLLVIKLFAYASMATLEMLTLNAVRYFCYRRDLLMFFLNIVFRLNLLILVVLQLLSVIILFIISLCSYYKFILDLYNINAVYLLFILFQI